VQKAALREQYKALFAAGGTGGAGKS
jgi:hypothetical protein